MNDVHLAHTSFNLMSKREKMVFGNGVYFYFKNGNAIVGCKIIKVGVVINANEIIISTVQIWIMYAK